MWTPPKLIPRHHEMIRQKFLGYSNQEIASNCGISPMAVHLVLKSPLANAELARLKQAAEDKITDLPNRMEVLQKINKATHDSLEYNSRIAAGEIPNIDPRLRVKVTSHFLDKTIFREKEEDEQQGTFKDLLRSMKRLEENIVNNPASAARVISSYKEVSE